MKILYGLCTLGLGHATRSLPVIRRLVAEGHDIEILSSGNGLNLLKLELGDSVTYRDMPDYSIPYTEDSKNFTVKFFFQSFSVVRQMIKERRIFERIAEREKYDTIISDARYGLYHQNVPSFLITHQLRNIAPNRFWPLEGGFELFNSYFQKHFRKVLIPDYEKNGLTGDMAHNLKRFDRKHLEYVGVMSDFTYQDVPKKYDTFISISGPEPTRTNLEESILKQLPQLSGKIGVGLGRLEDPEKPIPDAATGLADFHYLLKKVDRERLLNASGIIVSRSGYSTLMDLCVLGKKALFIPTPKQTEQEYLGEFHRKAGNFHSVTQKDLRLGDHLEAAKKLRGPPPHDYDPKKAVEKVMDVVFG